MVDAWLMKFMGSLLVVVGALVMFLGLFNGAQAFTFGLFICAGGSFLRYYSKQIHKPVDESDSSNANVANLVAIADKNLEKLSVDVGNKETPLLRVFSINEAILENDSFKIYLIKAFNIHKEPTLEKFIFNEKIYSSLDEALIDARIYYLQQVEK